MIELLADFPDNTVGIAASGHVNAAEYETVLVPAVEAALRKHDKVRLLYQLSSDFTGFTPGAMWDDMKLGMTHLTAWERVAVVTDIGWVTNATNMFRFVLPCPVRVFSIKDRAAADAWIAS
ncbi:MAG: STAS/SEC14 domain-containing protein [Polaromonas sp.]